MDRPPRDQTPSDPRDPRRRAHADELDEALLAAGHDEEAEEEEDWDEEEWAEHGYWDDDGEWHNWEDDEHDVVHDERYDAERRPRRTTKQRILLSIGVLAVIGCIVVAGYVAVTFNKFNQIERVEASELASEVGEDEPQNFLIVGSDSREALDENDPNAAVFTGGGETPFGQRADTMVIMRYDPEKERLDILSVPRDLWVPIAGHDTTDRINTAYSYDDGPNTLIATIEDSLGIPIHHYAEVNFQGFQDLVDVVGGVPMYFETLYQDVNSGFVISEPGCVTLGGQQALGFVRARHLEYMNEAGYWDSDPTGDLGRISRQQIFLRNALDEARGKMSILNPVEYNRMLDIAVDHLRLDEDLEPTKLAAMGQRFAEFEGESIESHTLPIIEFTTNGGAAVVKLDSGAAQPILNIFRGLDPDHIDPSWVDLQILNGSGVLGQAALVQEAYEAVGFHVSSVGDVPGVGDAGQPTSRVRYAPGSEYLAELVESHLTVPAELVEDPDLDSAEVILETGADFTTVEQIPRREVATAETTTPPSSAADASTTTATDGSTTTGDSTTTPTTDAVETTTPTTVIGHVPGEPPEGVDCG